MSEVAAESQDDIALMYKKSHGFVESSGENLSLNTHQYHQRTQVASRLHFFLTSFLSKLPSMFFSPSCLRGQFLLQPVFLYGSIQWVSLESSGCTTFHLKSCFLNLPRMNLCSPAPSYVLVTHSGVLLIYLR